MAGARGAAGVQGGVSGRARSVSRPVGRFCFIPESTGAHGKRWRENGPVSTRRICFCRDHAA